MSLPTKEESIQGVEAFESRERRDAMHKMATFLVSHFWGTPSDMADGLGVLLLTWNQAFYRYGNFDFDKLESCIARNLQKLGNFRKRKISTLSIHDEDDVKHLFVQFLDALQIDSGKKKGDKSPVAVAKALHLLAPDFFPLWDKGIAEAYDCQYGKEPAESYVSFCKIMRGMAGRIGQYVTRSGKTLLKLIDEYNYSKYTKKWI